MASPRETSSSTSQILLFALCLAGGFSYRIIVGVFSPSLLQLGVLSGLAAAFLLIAVLARRRPNCAKYWEIPLAFFIFSIAGIFGDSNSFASVQTAFVVNVLHESTSANNPIASSVLGTVTGQLVGSVGMILPILLLTRATGASLNSILVTMTRQWKWVLVGILGFALLFTLAAFGLSDSFFPNNGVTTSRFLALSPAILACVFSNGLREELFFRGLFLKRYGKFLGPVVSNVLSAIIFMSFHVSVTYSRSLIFFLAIALAQGLILGFLMQKSQSIIPGTIFHAGLDVPIYLVYLSYATS